MKRIIVVILMMIVLPLTLVGCGQEEVKLSEYTLNLEYDEEGKLLKGVEEVCYVNSSDTSFNNLLFHLYANAFREDAKNKPYTVASQNKAFPNGESYGDIVINSVKSGESELKFEIVGEDKNILSVTLPTELFPEESVLLQINFEVKLANINHRLGYGDNAINFGNFYPIACVYESGNGFITDVYSSNGDPFYSDCANYKVKMSYPDSFVMASSGEVLSSNSEDGKTTVYIEGNKIRDFCFVLSKNFKMISREVKGVKLNYYYYNDTTSENSLQVACDSVAFFNENFGEYPYTTLNIVETNFLNGGMEYPNLVMISDTCSSASEYQYVIVHEIAHQWWYGVVGNNEYSSAWQDEGLTEYSTMLFYKKNTQYNENFDELILNATSTYKHFVQVYTDINGKAVDTSMSRRLDEFATEPEYVHCTYTKGVLMFNTLREMVGERKFTKALRDYYRRYSYKNASPAEMIASFEGSTGYELESFFNSWLSGAVQIL